MVYLFTSLKYLTNADYLNSSLSKTWQYTQMISPVYGNWKTKSISSCGFPEDLPSLRYCSSIGLERLREIVTNLSRESRCSGRDSHVYDFNQLALLNKQSSNSDTTNLQDVYLKLI